MTKAKNDASEANQRMSEIFNDNGTGTGSGDTQVETANHQIQEQFYGNTKEANTLPFHVDVNNPPIKK